MDSPTRDDNCVLRMLHDSCVTEGVGRDVHPALSRRLPQRTDFPSSSISSTRSFACRPPPPLVQILHVSTREAALTCAWKLRGLLVFRQNYVLHHSRHREPSSAQDR